MTGSDVAAGFRRVEQRIQDACARSGRDSGDVMLVAVSKSFPADRALEALDAGAPFLGENRAQELRDKARALGDRAAGRWHFVGHLQTNKVRYVVGTASLIHSVDRYGLAEAVAKRAVALGVSQDVLIEVNLSGEVSKSGVEPARAADLALEVDALKGVTVTGLMSMPALPGTAEDSRGDFRTLRELRGSLAERLPGAVHLSMGMTRDFEVAVEEGATIVRVGEAIFGSRRAG